MPFCCSCERMIVGQFENQPADSQYSQCSSSFSVRGHVRGGAWLKPGCVVIDVGINSVFWQTLKLFEFRYTGTNSANRCE